MKKNLLTSMMTVVLAVGMVFSAVAATSASRSNENPSSVTIDNGSCISGSFVAREDGHIAVSIRLSSDCTFVMVERDGYDVTKTTGTYSIDGSVTRGQMADISFYANGSFAGSGRIAWPEDEGLCILFNGYVLRKE